MTRPYLPKMLTALREYQEREGEGWRYTVKEVADRNNVRPCHLSRAAKKLNVLRRPRLQ